MLTRSPFYMTSAAPVPDNVYRDGMSKSRLSSEEIQKAARKLSPEVAHKFAKDNMKQLMKDATTTGFTTGLGLNFYDLRRPVYLLNPVYTPLRNRLPRWDKTNAGYGTQPNWKAITGFGANQFPGLSEGNTNSNGVFTEKNYSSPYVTIGTNDYVTLEAISASEGYTDAMGDAKEVQLLRFLIQQEQTYIGGAGTGAAGGALQIGTTNTPSGVLSSLNNAIFVTGVLPVGSYAAAYAVALNYRAATNASNTVTAGITTQYLRSNSDGSADTINGGSGIVSAASAVVGPTVTGTKTIQFSCTPQAGAWGYAWFIQINTTTTFTPAPASAKLSGITSASTFNYYGQTQGTQTAAYSGSGGYAGFATDLSTNALDMDGLLTISSNTAYTSNLPVPAYPVNTATQTLLGNVLDLHGAGLTNNQVVGRIKEIDNVLQAMQLAALTSPTEIFLSSDQVQPFDLAFSSGSTVATQINYGINDPAADGTRINTGIKYYYNYFALDGSDPWIKVIQHPYLPTGTILFNCTQLGGAYSNSRMGEVTGLFVRRDTYGIEFAQTSRKYPFGVYSEEVLACKAPNILFVIKGAGAFGATNLF